MVALMCVNCGARLQLRSGANAGTVVCDFCDTVKILTKQEAVATTDVAKQQEESPESLLEHAYLLLENGDFVKAGQLFERVININPTNAVAHIGCLLVECKFTTEEQLPNYSGNLVDNEVFQRAVLLADTIYQMTLRGYEEANRQIRQEHHYVLGVRLLNSGKYSEALVQLALVGNYKDAPLLSDKATVLLEKMKRKRRMRRVIVAVCVVMILSVGLLFSSGILPPVSAEQARQVAEARRVFEPFTNSISMCNRSVSGNTIAVTIYGTVLLDSAHSLLLDRDALRHARMWEDITAVSMGDGHAVGLVADGTVVAVGDNAHGQLDVEEWEDIIAIAGGGDHTVGLRADGTVVAVGRNHHNQINVDGWRDIMAITAGSAHTVGLRADGTVVAVGAPGPGHINVDGWRDIVAISASQWHTVGLQANGTVVAVGSNSDGQRNVARWRGIVAIATGGSHTIGLRYDGTVVSAGSNARGQLDVSGWYDIIAVSAGLWGTVGIRIDGTVVTTMEGLDLSEWQLFDLDNME